MATDPRHAAMMNTDVPAFVSGLKVAYPAARLIVSKFQNFSAEIASVPNKLSSASSNSNHTPDRIPVIVQLAQSIVDAVESSGVGQWG